MIDGVPRVNDKKAGRSLGLSRGSTPSSITENGVIVTENTIPCVVFAFNRPDKLMRVLSALRNQGSERLFLFVDGPRNAADENLVEECRSIARSVDWAEKELFLWEENRGLGGLVGNIDVVFEAHESAMFLEDDCLPSPGFSRFMRQALTRYAPDSRVFSIGAYQPIHPRYFRKWPYCVVSSARFLCWGWGTWRDRWQTIRPFLDRHRGLCHSLRRVSDIAGHDLAVRARAIALDGREEEWETGSWGDKVAIAALWLKMVHLVATPGLVRNTGQDISGVHGGVASSLRSRFVQNRNVSSESPENPRWLHDTALDRDYSYHLQAFVRAATGSSLRVLWSRTKRVVLRHVRPRRQELNDIVRESDSCPPPAKRALLSYLVHPFSISREDPRFTRHINIWRAREMARAMSQMGYIVDVVDYRDTHFVPCREYDLFIGHGGINFERIASHLSRSTVRIYFSTGAYWKYHNEQESARFMALQDRRGAILPFDRYIHGDEESALAAAHGIIGIGNAFTRRTYSGFSPVVMLNDTVLFDDRCEWFEKDYERGRRHFLYYAGRGCVHKGLDLLLEAFLGLEEHLWICTEISRPFARLYARELRHHQNIHLVGRVQPRGRAYHEVMGTCDCAILPSASEAQPNSVLECMNQGLVPIVSEACSLDVDGYGLLLSPCTIEQIRRVVQMVSKFPTTRCREMGLRARGAAVTDFSEDAFSMNFRLAVETIICQREQERGGHITSVLKDLTACGLS